MLSLVNIFPHSVVVFLFGWWFTLLCKNFFIWFSSFLKYFLCFPCLRRHTKKFLQSAVSKRVLSMFSSRSFMVSGLRFKTLIYSELIHVYGVRKWTSFIFVSCICPGFSALCIEETVFIPLYIFVFFVIDQFTL